MADRVLRRDQVLARVGISRSTLYEWVKTGAFPPPVRLGARARGWIESELDEWLATRRAERSSGPSGAGGAINAPRR